MSRSRDKGTAFETAVVRLLEANGLTAKRTGTAWGQYGDIILKNLYSFVVLECKATQRVSVPDAFRQAEAACKRLLIDKGTYSPPTVIHKRPRAPIGQAYVTVSLETFVKLFKREL